ncbi:Neutral ceramidase 2 [Linum perenne]
MIQPSHYLVLLLLLLPLTVNGDYLIGTGSYDMTGPAAQVNLMGYANIQQNAAGIHFRLRARTFIVAETETGPRFAFVNLDAGMASQLVTIRVLDRLKSRYGSLYTEENVAISGTHTHAGPGGYLQYVLYIVTSLGFVRQSFDAIVQAIELSIVEAHNNLKPGSVFINTGEVENAGINRSPSAYLTNPPEERAKYASNVDKEMTLLKFVDATTGTSVGAFSWYATHGTSMSRDNKLISGDNKGAAARFFEDWYASTNTNTSSSTSVVDIVKLTDKAGTIKATGGRICQKSTSQGFRVRKDRKFVGAFCQSNVGDVTPNVLGAFCVDSGNPCDFNRSSCDGNDQLCVGRGPGYPDETLSTKMIGERQFNKAVELFTSASDKLDAKIDYRHIYLNFSSLEVELEGKGTVRTCPAAVGPGFAAGTTDGPGAFGFQQGDTEINPFLKLVRDFIKKPTKYQEDCQKPKPVLLSTGEMFDPYPWAAASTLYGPHTLSAYIQEFNKLATQLAKGENTNNTFRLSPPDLSSQQLGLLIEPLGESPPEGIKFGDIKHDVVAQSHFRSGDRVSATFWSANPRYDLLTEGTFAGVEILVQGEKWVPVFDDDDLSLSYKWGVDNATSVSLATIEWEIPEQKSNGVYRLRHFGSAKDTIISPVYYFTGASSGFVVG